jgi:secreted trypsin-like serine protease
MPVKVKKTGVKNSIHFKVYPVIGVLLSSLFTGQTQAILVRHDTTDSRYRILQADYPQVFYLHESSDRKICVATLVSNQWALTAAHCLYETPLAETLNTSNEYSVNLGKLSNSIDRVVTHPGFNADTSSSGTGVDLALLHLVEPLPYEGISLYAGNEETGIDAVFLGWGYTGNGLTGRNRDDGSFRRAENRVEHAGQQLIFSFDDPSELSSKALPLEGMPGMGDSGGPAILESTDGRFLIGIARGEVSSGPGVKQGLYGSNAIYERVSLHIQWLNSIISDQ